MVAFIAWMAFVLLEQNLNLNLMKSYVKIKIFLESVKNNMLKFNKYMKSEKMRYIIYTDIASLIKENRWMRKNPRKILQQQK